MKRTLIIIFCFSFFIIGYSISYVSQPTTQVALADCSFLPEEEQMFADQLSAIHRQLFCQIFSDDERVRAMSCAQKSRGNNPPDEGVEQVLKESRDVPEVSVKETCKKNSCRRVS